MKSRKIVGLGGGSLFFVRAMPDVFLSEDLSGSQFVLYDIDGEKVERMAERGRELAARAGTGFAVSATTDLAEAVDGADFAVSSIGGSGAEITDTVYGSPYHGADVSIPAKYGIQQVVGDTGGPGGMMMALRSLAAYMPICREMERRCPDVVFLNHSNPMAVLCRAMRKYTSLNVIGICHGVQTGIVRAARLLGISPQELEALWIGTNHYYWFTRLRHLGKDVYGELMRRLGEQTPDSGTELAVKLSLIYGHAIVYPQDDHIWEFYPFATNVGGFAGLPDGLRDAAREFGYDPDKPPTEVDRSDETREKFFAGYQEIVDKMDLPDEQDNSVTGEGLGAMMSAIAHGRGELVIANIPNEGAVSNLPATALVEVLAVTDSTGVRAVHMGDAPIHLKGILEKRFAWQELVADAGVKGDRNLALQALLLDEMAIMPDKAEAMLDELLAASEDLLPQFA